MTTSQAIAVGLAFIIAAVAMSLVFGIVFDNAAFGIGPGIAIGAGVAAAVYFAGRKRKRT